MRDESFFQDKVIVIAGASSGIGRATALVLSKLNTKVCIASRNLEKLESLRQEIESCGGQVLSGTEY